MDRVSRASGRPVTFTLVQSPDYPRDTWKELLAATREANATGSQLRPQVSSRPIGLVTGLSGYHAFQRRPTYMALAGLPLAERVRELARPEVKAAILSEPDTRVAEPGSMANVYGLMQRAAPLVYPLSDPVDYEPDASETLGARAAARGEDILSVLYDFLLEGDGTAMGSLMGGADVNASQEVLREMLLHPDTVTGLSDAGAHVTLICDASMPTTQLTFWARDRRKGERLPVEHLVHKQTGRNADLYGLSDRGRLQPGLRADVNVIDLENLSVAQGVPRSAGRWHAADPARAGVSGHHGQRCRHPPPRCRHRGSPRSPRAQPLRSGRGLGHHRPRHARTGRGGLRRPAQLRRR
jgi:N-acyl-D-aspartate/D-glutamate deacylase